MASAKTKNQTTTTDPIAEAEAALAAARGLLVQRQEEAETAREEHEELRNRLGWGDDSVTAEMMVRAQFDVDRTAGLIKAAQRDVQQAERALSKALAEHEAIVAEWVADAIRANAWGWGLWGIPVHLGKPTTDAPAPSVWISQEAATEQVMGQNIKLPTGRVTATVNLVVVTPDGEPISDAGPIMTAAKNLAQQAGGEASTSAGNHPQGTTVRLTFRSVIAGLPVLAEKLRDIRVAHGTLLRAAIEASPKELRQVRSIGPKELAPSVSGTVVSAELVDTHQDGRVITRTFDGMIKLRDAGRDLVDRVAQQIVGTDTLAGRIESVEIGGHEVRDLESAYGVYGSETAVSARIVTRFRLAR